MMKLLHRFPSILVTLLLAWATLLLPLIVSNQVSALPPVPAASCPAGIRDKGGQCSCPEGMTKRDCEALIGQWAPWVSDDLVCSAAPNTGAVTIEGSDHAKDAFLYFVGRGMTANQSAGMVGNLWAESRVEPATQEAKPIAGRGGYGIAQWTGSRRVSIENFAANIQATDPAKTAEYLKTSSTGKVLDSMQFQLDYLWEQELIKGYKKSVYDPLKQTTTIRDASNIWLHKFEAPADQSLAVENKRAAYGEKIYALYNSLAGTVTPTATTETPQSLCGNTPGANATFVGFPLRTTKARVAALNGGCLPDGAQTMCRAGHPYAAYDIMMDTGVPVLSLMDGKVITVTTDRCPGRMVSIYNSTADVTISYLHMSISNTMVKVGDDITAGQQIGIVGTSHEGCDQGSHLHIDAATGQPRPGCSRLDCPTANQAIFEAGDTKIGLGAGLYNGYKKLP